MQTMCDTDWSSLQRWRITLHLSTRFTSPSSKDKTYRITRIMSVHQLMVLGVCLFVCLSAASLVLSSSIKTVVDQDEQSVSNVEEQFIMPKMFDFSTFKSVFHKGYSSLVEELVRQKIFLGRAFSSFISKIGYKLSKLDYYEKVNIMSDWTWDDIKTIMRPSGVLLGLRNHKLSRNSTTKNEYKLPSMSLKDIKEKLKDIFENHSLEPVYADIAAELKLPQSAAAAQHRNNDTYIIVGSSGSIMQKFMADTYRSIFTLHNSDYDLDYVREKLRDRDGEILPDRVFVDLRDRDCLVEPKAQGLCNSCYIVSTTTLYEYAYCRHTGKKIEFSNQFTIDCGGQVGLEGCQGGHMVNVTKFVSSYGLELSANYPQAVGEGDCSGEKSGSLKVTNAELVDIDLELWEMMLKKGHPIAIMVYSDSNFLTYGGGIDDGHSCKDRTFAHAMVVVGYGRQNGLEYWLVRNSYGPSWGEQGYWRLNRRANCLIVDYGYVSYANFPDHS